MTERIANYSGVIPERLRPSRARADQGTREQGAWKGSDVRLHASSLSEGRSASMHDLAPLGRGQR